jgi:hypothetical protein
MRDLAENTVWRRFRYPWSSADDLQYPVVAHRDRRHLSWRARDLDVIAIAGHDPLSVALYGRRKGDPFRRRQPLYPGRLYVHEFPAFGATIQRLVDLTQDELVAHILGCHIEESKNAVVGLSDWTNPPRSVCSPQLHHLARFPQWD